MPVGGYAMPIGVLLSASYGNGHNAACRALLEANERAAGPLTLQMVDFFEDLVSRPASRAVGALYVWSVRHLPRAYGAFYYGTSRVAPDSATQRGINRLGRRALLDLAAEREPDVLLALHPTPAGAVASLKRAGRLEAKLVTIVTDYAVHSQWIHPESDLTIVGTERLREQLLARGLAPERVRVGGIPISPRFAAERTKLGERARLGLAPEPPTVLVMAGAFGMMRGLEEILACLGALPEAQAVFVCGHDRASRRGLEEAARPLGERVRVLGFSDEVPSLMAAADLCVTKAGGLTVSEALAMGLPLLIWRPIPGQEEWNARYLEECGAGCSARTPEGLRRTLGSLLSGKARLAAMSEAARAVARPDAARDAVLWTRELLG